MDVNSKRVYYECETCCYGVSGEQRSPSLDAKLDAHEQDNPGHAMKDMTDENEEGMDGR